MESWNSMFLGEYPEPYKTGGLMIVGPDLFSIDDEGEPLSPIASIFPAYNTLIAGRGIHAMHVATMVDLWKAKRQEEGADLGPEEEADIYENAVSLLVRGTVVLIRSNPEKMDLTFAADEALQKIAPKERIQFTGVHLEEVRRRLRWRGESWRVSPPPHSLEEIECCIRCSRVHVGSGAVYYQNAPTGGRFVTCEEFNRIRPMLRENRAEALARLREILDLSRLTNNMGVRELSFFLPADRNLPLKDLESLVAALDDVEHPCEVRAVERLFDCFAASFSELAGPDLAIDDWSGPIWRTTMFCRLYDINEKMLEEWTLGLSPEFFLNVRWLPGARIVFGELVFERTVESRVRSLITHFWRTWKGVVSINVGRVESSQTNRERTGEQREVYVIVLGRVDGREDIRLVRMIKWDVMHRLNMGVPQVQAISETFQYREYISDRLQAAAELGVPILSFAEIRFDEEIPGMGWIPVFFFDREYVTGLVSDKIPSAWFARKGFIMWLSYLLGAAAAVSLTLGRVDFRTRHVFFDDGDEVIQFNDEGLPVRLIVVETTGSFTDWSTPMAEMLPHCVEHLTRYVEKARGKGILREELALSVSGFANGLVEELERMKELLQASPSRLWSLFADRSNEPGTIRQRWEGVLRRLEETSTEELHRLVLESPDAAEYI